MEEAINLLTEFEAEKINRRKLLPWWMKIFCWIFMIFGLLAIGCLILGLLGFSTDLAFYGFETRQPLSFIGLLIIIVAVFKAITAFTLWFEKNYAVTLGKIDAILGIALCIISMLVIPIINRNFPTTIRLELALLIPYLIKLNKIQSTWHS